MPGPRSHTCALGSGVGTPPQTPEHLPESKPEVPCGSTGSSLRSNTARVSLPVQATQSWPCTSPLGQPTPGFLPLAPFLCCDGHAATSHLPWAGKQIKKAHNGGTWQLTEC